MHLFPKNPESLTLVKNASRLSQALKGCLELLFLDHLPALAFVRLQLSILLPVVNVQVSWSPHVARVAPRDISQWTCALVRWISQSKTPTSQFLR